MTCSEVRTFLSQINERQELITPIAPADLESLSANGYILRTIREDYDKEALGVARLSLLATQVETEKGTEGTTRCSFAARRGKGSFILNPF
jgi:hypothetical protein